MEPFSMTDSEKIIAALAILAFVMFMLIVGPFFSIWSINCLFGTEIPLTFKTWCSMAWVLFIIHSVRISTKKSSN